MRKILFGLAVLALFGGNAALAAPATPNVADECGDANGMVSAGDVNQSTPDAARAAGFDVKAAWFEDVLEGHDFAGVRVNLQMCGAVPGVELAGSTWSVHFEVSDSCSGVVYLLDTVDVADPSTGVVRGARLEQHCSSTSSGPIPNSSTTTARTDWIHVLDAGDYAVGGDTISWVLTPDMIGTGSNRVEFLSPESSWTAPRAFTKDARWGTQFADGLLGVSANGPGARDETASGTTFIVGETVE